MADDDVVLVARHHLAVRRLRQRGQSRSPEVPPEGRLHERRVDLPGRVERRRDVVHRRRALDKERRRVEAVERLRRPARRDEARRLLGARHRRDVEPDARLAGGERLLEEVLEFLARPQRLPPAELRQRLGLVASAVLVVLAVADEDNVAVDAARREQGLGQEWVEVVAVLQQQSVDGVVVARARAVDGEEAADRGHDVVARRGAVLMLDARCPEALLRVQLAVVPVRVPERVRRLRRGELVLQPRGQTGEARLRLLL
mmetsp:Transcript_15327/g.51559  ORF Transcript_15327/g.51559 Transcript_15327/m.51559 type:complete len:258 (+) Transcript_15327:201-974(+)